MSSKSSTTGDFHLNQSLQASVRDGIFYSIMLGAGETYLSPYGVFLEGSPLQIGLLISFPLLIGALFQVIGVQLMERCNKRRIIIICGGTIQALLWLPIAALAPLLGPGRTTVNLLIILATVYFAANHMTFPAWNSLIGDLVSPEIRGRFFGYRNKFVGLALISSLVAAGLFLNNYQNTSFAVYAFLLIFGIACTARLISAYWLSRHEDPDFTVRPEDKFSLIQFVRRTPRSNFAKFTFFYASTNFAVYLSVSYLAVYVLRELQFTYCQFMCITATCMGLTFLMMQRWGALADRFGNKKILNLCGTGIVIAPLLWLTTTNFYHILLIQIVAGFFWSGFHLSSANYLFDAVSPPKRARCTAYLWIINASFILTGSFIGGQIVNFLQANRYILDLPYVPSSPYMTIFAVSACLRLLVMIIYLPRFKEPRKVEAIKHYDLFFRITHLRPLAGVTFDVITGVLKNGKATVRKARTMLTNLSEMQIQLVRLHRRSNPDLPFQINQHEREQTKVDL
jgi:MFS family permease